MPAYAYRAVHASGRISRGEMVAANENELGHYLKESGLELIDAHEKRKHAGCLSFLQKRITPRELAAFCSRLHDLLQAGISFSDALHDIQTTTGNRILADALVQISQSIANGKGIAASFALFPDLFPPITIAIISAGEKSGDMVVIFDALARFAADSAQTQERMRRALRYPLFLFVVSGGAITFMMTIVIPQIVQFLNGIDERLPIATRLLLSFSTAFADYSSVFLGVAAFAAFCVFLAKKFLPSIAKIYDGFLLRLPVIGKVISKTDIARFARSFSILFRSGCAISDCLQQAVKTVGNRALQTDIEYAEGRILDGASLSLALDAVLPPFAIGMLRTGECSGNLGKSLDDIVAAYDREAAEATDSFIGFLEPCLTLVIGGFLAWTVLAVLGPLYGSLSVLGGRI